MPDLMEPVKYAAFLIKNYLCHTRSTEDLFDLNLCIGLSVTEFLLLVFLGFVSENVDFFALAVLQYVCSYISARDGGLACDEAFAGNRKHFVELDGVAFGGVELLNENDIAFLNLLR